MQPGSNFELGKPLLKRLDRAIETNRTSEVHRLNQPDHSNAFAAQIDENTLLNRYLESDYSNLVLYRSAVISKLNGGDPTPRDPLTDLRASALHKDEKTELALPDDRSFLSEAEDIQDILTSLTAMLSSQTVQP